ncbi:unnamed protein product [Diatraea saccharalis]|uniref:Carboxylesterase type B domain-containing protein n=1 Tax=Diatraea saccharalis TaxID=40085 RepID=A0A9N9RG08_9NEOP|nr:unnamed protein product [Diatraea saccharalis]
MYIFSYLLVIICLVNILLAQIIKQNVKVKTSEGTVIGFKENDSNYYGFYGVPYGGKSSGEYRFKEAPPPSKYEELIANKTDILCAQPSPTGMIGVEDCLTLNIFTKDVNITKPVIVWLGGEDYSETISVKNYLYKSFVDNDIVLIDVNYRLSIFGFLCLGVEEAPGNAGLKDVMQALKWIQNNIKAFGGDPNNIILLGHGSGAALVDLVTLSKHSNNLISKAIAISGSALSPWAVAYDPVSYAKSLSANLGIRLEDKNLIAKTLKATDAKKLTENINTFKFTNQSVLFAPCIENVKLKGWFLDDAPITLLKRKDYKPIPYIAGFVDKEGTIKIKEALNDNWFPRMQENFTHFLPIDLTFTDEHTKDNISRYIRKSYFGNDMISNSTIESFLDYESDSLIKYPILKSVKERAKASKNSTWLFTFYYEGDQNNGWNNDGVHLKGVGHGAILDYIFDNVKSDTVNLQAKQSLVRRIVTFVKTGYV